MKEKLKKLVVMALERGGHDLHIKTAFIPVIRVANEIIRLDVPAVTPKEMEQLVNLLLDTKHKKIFKSKGQVDCSYQMEDICRLRTNIFFQRNSLAVSMRLIEPKPPELASLGIPQFVQEQIAAVNRGMILITGATNSGKSTTAASIIHYLASTSSKHIITIEEPIEYVFSKYQNSIISQRQVREDTADFMAGLNASLRQDPDIILIGELRDQETVETCLKAAETGHLVLGTLHTANAVQSILRLINVFPSHQRESVRYMLSSSLRLIISQKLFPSADHKSRVLALEVLPLLPSVTNLIRQKKIHEISAILRVGRRQGCLPMSESIKTLLKNRQIDPKDIPDKLISDGS